MMDESFSVVEMAEFGTWLGRLEGMGETCSDGEEGGEDRGDESGSEWCILARLFGVVGGGAVVCSDFGAGGTGVG